MQKKDPNSQIQKKNAAKVNQASNLNKLKMERAIMQSDILQDKILKSKNRSKQVQATRKQNWDAINEAANDVKRSRTGTPAQEGETEQEEHDEDAMVEEDKFYSEEEDDGEEFKAQRNAFDLLNDEVEC